MANTNAPMGLRPVRHLTGGCIRANEYTIAAALATNIYTGDPVELTGTSKNIQRIAAVTNVDNLGVFAGCRYVNASGEQVFSKYWPSDSTATEIVAFVYDDPDIVFECQASTVAVTDYGTLVRWAFGTPSNATGQSGGYADGTTYGTADEHLRVIGLVPRPDNAAGAYAKIEVIWAEHALKGVIAGVGGV